MVSDVVYAGVIVVLIVSLFITRNIHEIMRSGTARNPDGYVHMIISREFRKNNHRVPKNISANVFDWQFSYPYLMHFLLSFIPEKYYETIDRVFPTVIDFVYVGILIALVPFGLIHIGELPLVLALFITTPQFIQYAGGMGVSARKPGIILGTLSFLSFYFWTSGGDPWLVLVSAVFAGLTHLTSRFGTQAIIFFYLGFVIVDLMALAVLTVSFVLAILLSLGYYLVVLRSHLVFWHNYATRSQFVFLYDGFKSIDTIWRFLQARKLKEILSTFHNSVLLKSLLNNPYAVAAGVILMWGLLTSPMTISKPIAIWFGTGFVLCVLTSLYGLRFLGQPGRYLNYAFVPGALIVTTTKSQSLLISHQLLIVFVLVVGLSVMAGYALFHRMTSSRGANQPMNDVVEFLNGRDPGSIVVQPRHMGSEIAWKMPNASVTDYFGDGYCSKSAKSQAELIFSSEPFITDDTEYLTQLFNPDWAVFNQESVSTEGKTILRPPDVDAAFESDHLEVYQWNDVVNNQ